MGTLLIRQFSRKQRCKCAIAIEVECTGSRSLKHKREEKRGYEYGLLIGRYIIEMS